MAAEHEAVVRRFLEEVVNEGRERSAEELASPATRLTTPYTDLGHGAEGLRQLAGILRRAFPDLRVDVEDIFSAGSNVAARWRAGPHEHAGPYRGIPPTRKHVDLTGILLARVEDGRITALWLELDELAALRQMKLVPPEEISTPRRGLFMVASALRFTLLDAKERSAGPAPAGARRAAASGSASVVARPAKATGDDGTVEQHIAVVHRTFDHVINKGQLDEAEEVTSSTTLIHVPFGGPNVGPHALRTLVTGLRTGFPDLLLEIEFEFGVGDRVASRWRSTRQTHLGPYRGIPPTGKSVNTTGIDIFRFENGRIEELWMEMDQVSAVRQMGVIPPEGAHGARRALFTLGSIPRMAFLEAKHGIARARASKGAASAR